MSWSINTGGLEREAAKTELGRQYDTTAAMYKGNEEAKDILAVKERVLSLIDAMDLAEGEKVSVVSSGSHAWNQRGITHAQFHVTINKTS